MAEDGPPRQRRIAYRVVAMAAGKGSGSPASGPKHGEMIGTVARVLALLLLVTSCASEEALSADPLDGIDAERIGDWSAVWDERDGMSLFSWTDGERFVVNTADGERDFVAGVNLGVTVPGHFPGELAVDAETYRRWFPQIASIGFSAIRVYTMLEPHFYEELVRYNTANPRRPLYLVQGVWPPEGAFLELGDLYGGTVTEAFESEIDALVAALHGETVVADRPGRADGAFTADVSPWLLAWAVGIEWDPIAVERTDAANAGMEPFSGQYFTADAASTPTESWMAQMLDHLAGRLAERGTTMPLSFVNWTTTDPLHHPDEPNPTEEMVSIDPMHVRATEAWPGGYFAGYHIYPYYPDFQRFEDGVADFVLEGEPDAYAGLLSKFAEHHRGVPLVVLEYGVPTGMAKAHEGPQGRDQGDHTEQRQAEINAELLSAIAEVGLAGGYQFAWTDEWFKLTWNTMDFEVAVRRPMWMNAWTNEAHFGILAVEPGATQRIVLDGDGAEWDGESQVIFEGTGAVRELAVTHDEGYLYLRVVTDEPESWRSDPITIVFDVIDGAAGALPDDPRVESDSDYALRIAGDGAELLVRSSADPLLLQYIHHGYVTADSGELVEGNGRWNPHRLMTNRPQVVPSTGMELPVEFDDAGRLHHGTSDPASAEFDSRSTWFGRERLIEVRVPWQGIGVSDPSSRQAYVVDRDGRITHVPFERLGIDVAAGDVVEATAGYAWPQWNSVAYHERIKAGAGVFADVVIRLNAVSQDTATR